MKRRKEAPLLSALLNTTNADLPPDDDEPDDDAGDTLIKDAITGDKDALGKLYNRHRSAIYQYFYYRVSDAQIANDLTSDVFVSMIEAIPSYEPRGVPFRAWLFRIARNRVVDYFRREGRYDETKLTEDLKASKRTAATVELHLTSESLQRALRFLNDDQRDVVILRFVLEMPIAETAQTLGKTENSVKGLQRRGLTALRRALADQ